MLLAEARWLAHSLDELEVDDLSPLLNVGSHTQEFRTRVQPWIDEVLIEPLVRRGVSMEYADLRPGAGVDHVGDLTDPDFVGMLQARGYRAVLCSNLLEHVPDPGHLAAALASIPVPGGLLIYSGPHRFPYHADPIDNMFRPAAAELPAIFPGTAVLSASQVSCGTFASYLLRRLAASPTRVLRDARGKTGRAATPAARATDTQPRTGDRHDGKSAVRRFLPWLVRRFTVTCAVLRKPTDR